MRNFFFLLLFSSLLGGCASGFKVGIEEKGFYPITINNIVYIDKEICDQKTCFLSKCPIVGELHSAFVSSLIKKGFEITDSKEKANYHIKITSLFKKKYVGQKPENFFFTVIKKDEEKQIKVLRMAFAKDYNEKFFKNDLDFNKIINLSVNTITEKQMPFYEL